MKDKLRTIVGGRSAEYHDQNNFPRGIEILLKKAKVDLEFQKLFLENPLAAAESIDLDLKENEKKILSNTLKPVLKTMIVRTFVPKHHTNTFLTAKTAAMLALVLASTVADPSYAKSMGITAEDEQNKSSILLPTSDNIPKADQSKPQPESLRQLTKDSMRKVQNALEQYKNDHGAYPSTELWLNADNPLSEYVLTYDVYDAWDRKFHYEAVIGSDKILNYKLESLGKNINKSRDNIPCPINTKKHRF
jgi:hypothetical protein